MLNVAVVDDRTEDGFKLYDYITQYCSNNNLEVNIIVFSSGEDILTSYEKDYFKLIFMDMYMGGMTGIDTAREIRKIDTDVLIVFVSVSSHHAVDSFRVRAFDYLLKPFDYQQFTEVMELCEHKIFKKGRFIEVKEKGILIKVALNDIIYADYDNHYIQLHLVDDKQVKSYMPFSKLADILLQYPQFLSCYRNCILNMDHVTSFDGNCFLMSNEDNLSFSQSQKNVIKKQFLDYEFERMHGNGNNI